MIHALATAFLVVFVGAHLADQQGDAITRPLSCFRDVEPAWIGYTMFALLVAIALEMCLTCRRLNHRKQSFVYAVVTCSLTLIAVTPSYSGLHDLGVVVTLFTLFANFAWLLDQRDMPYWLTAHLSIPLALVAIDFLAPSGTWQKALDVYFMAAVMIHHHAMQKPLALPRSLPPSVENETATTF